MLKSFQLAVVISFLWGAAPASAAQSCQDWCMQNRCARGVVSQPLYISKYVPACEQKRAKGR